MSQATGESATPTPTTGGDPVSSPTSTQKFDPNRVIRVWRADNYPRQMWYMLGIVIFFFILAYVARLVWAWYDIRRYKSGLAKGGDRHEERSPDVRDKALRWGRLPRAVVNASRIVLFRITIPLGGGAVTNMAEVGLVCGYILAVFLWEFLNTMNIVTREKINANYYSNRAGNIAIYQYPLMVLLSGKNNLLSYVTGISYEKLNVLHRASARLNFLLVLVHTFGRIKIKLKGESSINVWWMVIGAAATVTYLVVFIIGFRPLRTKFYEAFVAIHFVFVLFTLIGSYYHTKGSTGYQLILIPTFVFWALDRTTRTLHILWHARPITDDTPQKHRVSLTARGEILPHASGASESVRLTLRRRMTWQAGQTVLLSVPTVSTIPFEAHPFTIANIPGDISLSRGVVNGGGGEDDVKTPSSEKHPAVDLNGNGGHGAGGVSDGVNDLVFMVKVKGGFTKRLRDAVLIGTENGASEAELKVFLDGPYGSPISAVEQGVYERSVLVGGGSGVTYILPVLQDIVKNVRNGSSRTRDVLFLWSVPHKVQFSWISNALLHVLRTAPSNLQVRIWLHCTRTVDGSSLRGSSGSNSTSLDGPAPEDKKERLDSAAGKEAEEGWLNTPGISVKTGRPDVRSILADEVGATSSAGGVCVHVAGPASLADSVRAALRFDVAGPGVVMHGSTSVRLHVETYRIA